MGRDIFSVPDALLSIFTPLLPTYVCLPYYILAVTTFLRVFGRTLSHEFRISYGHTESHLLFSRDEIVLASAEASPIND